MDRDKVKQLLSKQRFMQDSFQQQLMEALEPTGSRGDIYSNILATSSNLRVRCRAGLAQLEKE